MTFPQCLSGVIWLCTGCRQHYIIIFKSSPVSVSKGFIHVATMEGRRGGGGGYLNMDTVMHGDIIIHNYFM